jgi:hypothetical protein
MSLLGVVATVVALGVPAQGAVSAPVPPRDSVVGSGFTRRGDVTGPFTQVSITAESDALGGNPSGGVSFVIPAIPGFPPDFHFAGPVTCLRVDGNRAVIGFVDQIIEFPFPGPITVWVNDNGPGNLDRLYASPIATDCSTTADLDLYEFVGDIVVRDAPSKDQCRSGGWRSYTDATGRPFKSQGDCIAFALGAS